jgi:sialate O-acetylesterase
VKTKSLLVYAVVAWCGVSVSALAEIKLAPIFTDNMVLQRDSPINVWGTGSPGEHLTLQLAAQKRATDVDATGHWKTVFDPLPADGTALTLTVAGTNTITLANVVAGDVWICSGQSNMEFPLSHCLNAKTEMATANNPLIRVIDYNYLVYPKNSEYAESPGVEGVMLMQNHLASHITIGDELAAHQTWVPLNPDTAGFCSGVAYYFSRDLYAAQKIPIGLVMCAVGAQCVQTFISPDALKTDPALVPMVPLLERQNEDRVKAWTAQLAKWKDALAQPGADAAKIGPPPAPIRVNELSWVYNEVVSGVIPLSIKGVLWYQGESNGAEGYHTLFEGLIRDWRKQWGQGDFPFLFVQLPNFGKPDADPNEVSVRAGMREEQAQALSEPNTAMAVLVDTSNNTDLHPLNKEPVGHRLALLARAHVYGEKIVADSPSFASAALEGAKVRIRFKQIGSGLMLSNGDKLEGFALAGEDKHFVWADAQLDGDSVLVGSDAVPAPKFVRYAWLNDPICNLANKEGLPAAPFQAELK